MTDLKFDRIFGQGATSTQQFTDSEYSRGWGFLGQEPPPYELFDDFFKNTDLKLKFLKNKQDEASNAQIAHNSTEDAHSVAFAAHNNDKNAHKPITDVIKALKGTSAFDTSVSKSVTEIITLLGMGGIVAAKLDANAGFVKFANGFIIQWTHYTFNTSDKVAEIKMPLALTTQYYCSAQDVGAGTVATGISADNTSCKLYRNDTSILQAFHILVIGTN